MIGYYWFHVKHPSLKSMSKEWLPHSQLNVSGWAKRYSHMLTVLTVISTMKIQLYVGLIQRSTMSIGGAICLHADCSFSTSNIFYRSNDKRIRHKLNNPDSLLPLHIYKIHNWTFRKYWMTQPVTSIITIHFLCWCNTKQQQYLIKTFFDLVITLYRVYLRNGTLGVI